MADALADLGEPIPDRTLVLNVLRGLNERFQFMSQLITRQRPFPSFADVRADLRLAELNMAPPSGPPSALVASSYSKAPASPTTSSAPAFPRPHQAAGGASSGNGRGRRHRGGRGQGSPQGSAQGSPQGGSQGGAPGSVLGAAPWPSVLNPWTGSIHMWPGSAPGGSRSPPPRAPPPQHALAAYYASPPAPGAFYPAQPQAASPTWSPWTPESLASAFSTVALTPPPSSSEWVFDSGASSHIAGNPGMVTMLPTSSFPSSIVVGNGATLPVVGTGYSTLNGPFHLNNVLIAPDIIKNLLSIRQFTIDNFVSVEFDPLGVSVKDLRTRNLLLRCDSSGPLYTLQLPTSPSGSCALVATPSSTTWHRRLGHPGKAALQTLAKSSSICDNGREFDNSTSRASFSAKGVTLRMSCPYTSQQNGKAERMIRTVNNVTRTLLIQASMPPTYWADALATATLLLNRLPTKTLHMSTPFFALHGTLPSYHDLRAFGCTCYPNLTATTPHKLAPRSSLCAFLGYSPNHKGYKCLDVATNRVIISRHVVFDETTFPFSLRRSLAPPHELDFLTNDDSSSVSVSPAGTTRAASNVPATTPHQLVPNLDISAPGSPPPGFPVPRRPLGVPAPSSAQSVQAPAAVQAPAVVQVLTAPPSPAAAVQAPTAPPSPAAAVQAPTAPPSPVPMAAAPAPPSPVPMAAAPVQPPPAPLFSKPPVVQVYTRRAPTSSSPPEPTGGPLPRRSSMVPSPPRYVKHGPTIGTVPIPPVTNDHGMATRGKSGYRQPRLAMHAEPLSPIPQSCRDALANPHWRRAMEEEYAALLDNNTWDLVPRPAKDNVVTGKWIFKHKFHADGSLD
ncbi:proline-rich protein 36, partial [Sorghum bicolor]|uniref:proline-rich protein 36 n=1 Tax=Sorghum bicolor TaxID=4558 RepID=UPI000B424BF6